MVWNWRRNMAHGVILSNLHGFTTQVLVGCSSAALTPGLDIFQLRLELASGGLN
jgi:hypothetical protein